MRTTYVVDNIGALGKLERTATGGYRVPATLARVGVMPYLDGKGGTIRHYNPPSVLQASFAAVVDAPVTHNHPAKMVSPANYKTVAAGHVLGSPTFTDGHIHAVLAIQDAALINALEVGSCREVSMGYSVDFEETPGVTPEGEAYDVIRTSLAWNHIALVPQGRAGRTVRCMLDSQDIPTEEADVTYKIDGADVAQDKAQAGIDALCAARDVNKAKCDELAAQIADLQAKLEAAQSEETMDAAVSARLAKIEADRAAALALEQAASRRQQVADACPGLSLEGKSQDYVDAIFDLRVKDPDGLRKLSGEATRVDVAVKDAAPKLSARERMVQTLRDAAPTEDATEDAAE